MIGDRVPVGGNNVAEDVVSTVLVKEGKDAVGKAESSYEKHGCFTSTAGAKVPAIDKKIGQITLGNEKAREMDQKLRVSDKTKSALAAADQTVSSAGSAIMKNTRVKSPRPPMTSVIREDAG